MTEPEEPVAAEAHEHDAAETAEDGAMGTSGEHTDAEPAAE